MELVYWTELAIGSNYGKLTDHRTTKIPSWMKFGSSIPLAFWIASILTPYCFEIEYSVSPCGSHQSPFVSHQSLVIWIPKYTRLTLVRKTTMQGTEVSLLQTNHISIQAEENFLSSEKKLRTYQVHGDQQPHRIWQIWAWRWALSPSSNLGCRIYFSQGLVSPNLSASTQEYTIVSTMLLSLLPIVAQRAKKFPSVKV